MSNLTGKIALVTGASKGIGASVAKHLAKCGAAVAVSYASSIESAELVVREIVSAGGRAIAVQGDISDPQAIERIFSEVKSTLGPTNILINNAGRFVLGTLETVTPETYHQNFDTNVLGLLLTTKAAVTQFGADGGVIVNIGSALTSSPTPFTLTYGATKAAVDYVTKALAIELGPKKIRVNAVLPGPTKTEGAAASGAMTDEFVGAIVQRTPLGRAGLPEDIALVVAFLASDDARWLTGQLVAATGGLH